MIRWIPLTQNKQIQNIIESSYQKPSIIFKHSTRCSISAVAKYRLESTWNFDETELDVYFLDLLRYRAVSNEVSEKFDVYHESPQMLLIQQGQCTCDASHLDISVDEIRSCLQSINNKSFLIPLE